MPRIKSAVVLLLSLTGVVGAAVILMPGGPLEEGPTALKWAQRLAGTADHAMTVVLGTLELGRQRAPAVVAGLFALVLVPLVALAAYLARRVDAVRAWRRVGAARARRAANAAVPRLTNVWIDVDGPARHRLRIAGELISIGRDEENDLRLEDPNVHRHHALIQRTSDAEFVVVDVSGIRGSGVAVNGRRLARARLRDGDLIELGTSRVRFRCEPISRAISV